MAGEKEYTGTIDLAHRSSTDDAEGDVTPVHVDVPPTLDQLRGALPAFVGHIQQIPPNFSALNIGGRRAYQIAREGGEVTLAAREVFIRDFTITRYEWPFVDVHVTCGKGTYIRSLARDLGAAVACGGMLTQLRRTRVGRFDIRNSRPLQELPQVLTQADLLPVPLDLS
jgi:tRNA pseudouridine55 synthase